jgi:hypothetical protein
VLIEKIRYDNVPGYASLPACVLIEKIRYDKVPGYASLPACVLIEKIRYDSARNSISTHAGSDAYPGKIVS